MKNQAIRSFFESRRIKPWVYAVAMLVNVLFILFIGWVYLSSSRSYSQRLYEENIQSVENLNIAAANAAYTYSNSMGTKVEDIVSFVKARDFSYEETVQYLCDANTDPDRQYQLVQSGVYGEADTLRFGDYSGISVRKALRSDGSMETLLSEIQYGSGYYDILQSFTDVNDESFHGVCFAPEFTDPDTKLKCFAVYRHITLTNAEGRKALYTLLLAVNSSTAANAYDMQREYEGQSTVLVNPNGDYIVKNSEYRNANFFDYIINYNGLSLDWQEALPRKIREGTAQDGSSVNLYYRNHQGADCVFSVTAMKNGWYGITCVPLSSFHVNNSAPDYSLIILSMFLALFAIDGFVVYIIGKAMRENVTVAERATKEANEANQAKSRFLSSMSHELRTPLNAIIGLVALSGDSLNNPPILKDYLRKIDISSKLLLQLISDILDVSAIESNKLKLARDEFDITKLITALSAVYYDQCAAKGIEFRVALKDMHSEILVGDSVRLNQVLLNFLSNAIKFTPKGGSVVLSAEQVKREDASVVIRFSVSDTGCGISDELKTRLFMPFERASGSAANRYGGTGLGLSISKNLVKLMNGTVGMESEEGVGSVFWAEIPFAISADTPRRSFSPIENLRILAAISDDAERAYIGQILSGFGVERVMTDSADAALALVREYIDDQKPFNLCLLDWKLSDLSGLDAAGRLRDTFGERAPRTVILAYDIAEASLQCAATGADLVFGKPVFPSALYNFLEGLSSGDARTIPIPDRRFDLTGKRVLLVEDNLLNTEVAQKLLNKVGVQVETARNGELGLARFLASKPGHFDAILMDVQMPVMDGYQATAAIRASAHPQGKTIPILAMTADAFTEDVEKARQAGMNEHISKPVVPEALYSVLTKYLFG